MAYAMDDARAAGGGSPDSPRPGPYHFHALHAAALWGRNAGNVASLLRQMEERDARASRPAAPRVDAEPAPLRAAGRRARQDGVLSLRRRRVGGIARGRARGHLDRVRL